MSEANELNSNLRVCEHLQPIFDLEARLGNELLLGFRISASPVGLGVVFSHPIHRLEVEEALSLGPMIEWRENYDTHYSIEGGFVCSEHHDIVTGPLEGQPFGYSKRMS